MKLLFVHFFLTIMTGFNCIVSGSPTSDTVANQKQQCGGHKWILEHNPCPNKDRHPKFDGQHWDCCDHLTEEDQKLTAHERQRIHEKHEKDTDHGRCMGRRIVGKMPPCTTGKFNTPKLRANGLWDCCMSLTPEEEQTSEKRKNYNKQLCNDDDFEHYGFVVHPYSCVPGHYAKKDDPNSSGEYRTQWSCCPELKDEEKKIGDQQRKDAKKDAESYREWIKKSDKATGASLDNKYGSCKDDYRICQSVPPTTHRS